MKKFGLLTFLNDNEENEIRVRMPFQKAPTQEVISQEDYQKLLSHLILLALPTPSTHTH